MSDAPPVKPGDWITVGSIDSVVTAVRGIDLTATDLEVVCNPERPALYQVNWDGEAWAFAHPMRGDYAEHHSPDVARFVEILKRGTGGQ